MDLLGKVSSVSSTIKNKVEQKVREISTNDKPSGSHSLDDENYEAIYQRFVQLSKSMSALGNRIRESMSSIQKMTIVTQETSHFFQNELSSTFSPTSEVIDAVTKFSSVHNTVASRYLNDLLSAADGDVLKAIVREREADQETKLLLEERKRTLSEYDSYVKSLNSTGDAEKIESYRKRIHMVKSRYQNQCEHLIDHLNKRNDRATNLIIKSIALTMQIEHDYFGAVAGLFGDLAPSISKIQSFAPSTSANRTSQKPANQVKTPTVPLEPNVPTIQKQVPLETQSTRSKTAQVRDSLFNIDSNNAPQSHVPPPTHSTPPTQAPINFMDDILSQPTQNQQQQYQQPQNPQQQYQQPQNQQQQHPSYQQQPYQQPYQQQAQQQQSFSTPSKVASTSAMFEFDLNQDDLVSQLGEQPMQPTSSDPFFAFASTPTRATNTSNVFDELNSLGGSPNKVPAQRQPPPVQKPQQPQPQDLFSHMFPGETPSKTNDDDEPTVPKFVTTSSDFNKTQSTQRQDEEAEHELRRELDGDITRKVELWAGGRRDNVRSLLSNLHTVLWEDSGWKQVTLAELIQPSRVKVTYKKSLLYIHPDKVTGRPVEERLLAERVFNMLQEAYKKEEPNLN